MSDLKRNSKLKLNRIIILQIKLIVNFKYNADKHLKNLKLNSKFY